jgi:hypothetical protein
MKYDIFNASSTPDDSDFDTIPDIVDLDDDNDGWPDLIEEERGSDTFDEDETPFTMYGPESGFFFVPGKGFTNEYHNDGFEISLSWLFSALSSELIIPIGLIPVYTFMRLSRNKKFRTFDISIREVTSVTDLVAIENEINNAMRNRKLHTHHGIILRNAIERREDEINDDWHLEYGPTTKKAPSEEE